MKDMLSEIQESHFDLHNHDLVKINNKLLKIINLVVGLLIIN